MSDCSTEVAMIANVFIIVNRILYVFDKMSGRERYDGVLVLSCCTCSYFSRQARHGFPALHLGGLTPLYLDQPLHLSPNAAARSAALFAFLSAVTLSFTDLIRSSSLCTAR